MDNNEKTEMKTLSKVMAKLTQDGYAENFIIEEESLKIAGAEKKYGPQEVKIANFYRFEGESDPADTSILYAIETADGNRGTLVDAYGLYADDETGEFMKEVEIHKKVTEGRWDE